MSELLQAKYDNYIKSANGYRWEAEQPGVSDAQKAAWLAMASEADNDAKAIWMQIESAQGKAAKSPSGLPPGGEPDVAKEPKKDAEIPLSVTVTGDWRQV